MSAPGAKPALPLEVIVVGAGRMGLRYAESLHAHPASTVAAIVGRTEQGLEAARARLPDVPTHAGGLDASILSRHPRVGAVVIATPEWAHIAPTRIALEAGCHVLLEKPVADSVEDALALLAIAEGDPERVVMPCHTARFDSRSMKARALLASGALGAVRRIYARRNADRAAFERINGKTDPLFWLLPHDLDLAAWLIGSPIASVRARTIAGPTGIGGVVCEVRFQSGADGTLETLWCSPPNGGGQRNALLDVFADDGVLELSPYQGGVTHYTANGVVNAVDPYYEPATQAFVAGADAALVDHFVRVIVAGERPVCALHDGVRAVAAAHAARLSLKDGCEHAPVALP